MEAERELFRGARRGSAGYAVAGGKRSSYEKQNLLDQKIAELVNMPDALRAEHEQELEATKAALMDELKANMENSVMKSLQEKQRSIGTGKRELAAKHSKSQGRRRKIAIQEANLLAEKELLERR